MPGDETTGNLILGAAVVAAAWFLSAPLRGASNAAGDVGGFVGDVATGTTGFVADAADGTADVIGGVVGGGGEVVNETLGVPGDIVRTGQDAFTGATDFGGDIVGGAGDALGGAGDAIGDTVDNLNPF